MPKIMPLRPEWEKLDFAGRPVGVDRKARVLRGYVVAQEGPFKSLGRGEFDRKALDMIVEQMNAQDKGIKSRFTHPDMSSDGLGKFLGRAHGARLDQAVVERDGKQVALAAVRADLHLDPTSFETPSGNLGQYVLDLAESDPEALSSSLVLTTDKELRLEQDGTAKKDEKGNPLPPLWRPKQIRATDIVDTGDAVDGILSAGVNVDGLPLSALWRGAELLDGVFNGQPRDVVEARCLAWLERYLSARYGEAVLPPAVEAVLQVERASLADLRKRLELRCKLAGLKPQDLDEILGKLPKPAPAAQINTESFLKP